MPGSDGSALNQPKFICFGEGLVDRLGPLGGNPDCDLPVDDCLGGAPANVACGLAKLGNDVAFIGRFGNDSIGRDFRKLMTHRGVNLKGCQIDLLRPTRIVLVQRDLKGDRTFKGFSGDQKDGFSDQAIDCQSISKVWDYLHKKACWLLIGSIPLASPVSAESLLWCIDRAKKNGLRIAFDVNWRPTFWDAKLPANSGPSENVKELIATLFESASLLKLAREEAIWFFNETDPCLISRSLPLSPDVVITDGSKKVKWWMFGRQGETDVMPVRSVVDTTGAGDAFTAGLLHQYLLKNVFPDQELYPDNMVRFAAACGAMVCGGAGAISPQPSKHEVEVFLSSFEGLIS